MKTFTSKTTVVTLSLYNTVGALKHILASREGCLPHQQHLLYAGRILEDSSRLFECGVSYHSTIHICLRLRGGAANFADVSNKSTLLPQNFSPSASTWRISVYGLNVEGKCVNNQCAAYNQMVIDGKGMVSWSLIADKANCPVCHQQITPTTCAFTGCLWAFDGRKIGSKGFLEDVEGSWQTASGEQYHRFQEEDNQANWHMLVLSAKSAKLSSSPLPTNVCPICFEVPDEKIRHFTPCRHSFHESCIAAWKHARPQAGCPICRAPL